jgi:hypothetical protein
MGLSPISSGYSSTAGGSSSGLLIEPGIINNGDNVLAKAVMSAIPLGVP